MEQLKKGNVKKYILIALAVICVSLLLIADVLHNQNTAVTEKSDVAMGTVITSKLYGKGGEEITAKLTDEFNRLENNILSWRVSASDIAKINSNGSATVSSETVDYIKKAIAVSEKSGGALDITVGTLSKLWDIGGQNARVPSPDEITNALKNTDFRKIKIDNSTVTIGESQQLDLGALGKGIACDAAKKILDESELSGGVVSVGGSILLWGDKPDGGDWQIGVRDPRGEQTDSMGVLSLKNGCVSTSGDYERVLTVYGKNYHHILNPKTGYPAESSVISVTIVSDSGLLSDALSTACFVLGADDGMKLLKEFGAEGIFVTSDKRVIVSDGLKDKFTVKNTDYTLENS